MNTFARKLFLGVAASAAMVFAYSPASFADLALTLHAGDGTTITTTTATDSVFYNGAVGSNWSINVTTGLSYPGSLGYPNLLDLNSIDTTTTGTGTLNITLVATGFTGLDAIQNFVDAIGGTAGGTVDSQLWLDNSNVGGVGVGTLLSSLGTFGPGGFTGSNSMIASTNDPFALTLYMTIHHTSATVTSFDQNISGVPEPSTLGIFGVGLIGLGLVGIRRRKAGRG